MTPPKIPEETLRATFERRRFAYRNWPESFSDAMADPIIRRLIEILARQDVAAIARKKAPRFQLRGLSGKDRAAGERDDD